MRQVPKKFDYLIVGSGRLAHHLHFYFKSFNFSLCTWSRKSSPETLKALIKESSYCLLCIPDGAINDFCDQYCDLPTPFVHFSGAVETKKAYGFHPLMTFGHKLYEQNFYKQIPFIGSHSKQTFKQVFPKLKNTYKQIPAHKKSLYHGLCVLSGNGTTLLWEKALQQFEELGLSRDILAPYISQITENIINQHPGRFTGPWYRDDQKTIQGHQMDFEKTELNHLYRTLKQLSQGMEV